MALDVMLFDFFLVCRILGVCGEYFWVIFFLFCGFFVFDLMFKYLAKLRILWGLG